MGIDRRHFMGLSAAAILAAGVQPALALSESQARAHVETTMNELLGLLKSNGSAAERAQQLRRIMETRANLPLIAKFSAGRAWRDMSGAQKDNYVEAFSQYVSVTYARRFNDYSDRPEIRIGRVVNAGRKGVLVETPIAMPGRETIVVEWLVSDRGGRVEVVDIVIEGISMAATQREEMSAMLEKRGGNVDQLIAALKAEK